MITAFIVTISPVLFLIVLFGGGESFRRKKIDMDGKAPINKTLFYLSKYSILILWVVMVLSAWGYPCPCSKYLHSYSGSPCFFGFLDLRSSFLGDSALGILSVLEPQKKAHISR